MLTPSGRFSQWQVTFPFALNNRFYSNIVESESFQTALNEAIPQLVEFSPLGSDPSGWRHRVEHPTFVQILASGTGRATLNFGSFDLQATDISRGSGVSKTKAFLFRIERFTSPGVTRAHNMKVWASDTTDFLTPETHRILFQVSSPWSSGFAFTEADINNEALWMPTSLPASQNLFRTDGGRTIHGSGDADVSQWVYCALSASGTLPLGEYGDVTDGPEGFNIRVTYNIDNLFPFFD
jgi:hypothetical protein